MTDTGIVILNYFSSKDCIRLTKEIRESGCLNPIVLIDNSLSEEEARNLSLLKGEGPIKIVRNEINEGYYKGNFLGLAILSDVYDCAYGLIINPDVSAADWRKTLEGLRGLFTGDEKLFSAGPLIRIPGAYQRNSPFPSFRFPVECMKNFLFPLSYLAGKVTSRVRSRYRSQPFALEGSCIMTSIDKYLSLELHFTSIFLFGEEIIFGLESIKRGWTNEYLPYVEVNHHHLPGQVDKEADQQRKNSMREISTNYCKSSFIRFVYRLSLNYRFRIKDIIHGILR